MGHTIEINLKQEQDYRFAIGFGAGMAVLYGDEAPPLGAGSGPTPGQRLAAARGVPVDFAVANVVSLDWPTAMYDVIATIFIQFATPDERTQLFRWLKRALKPGGVLILRGDREEQLG